MTTTPTDDEALVERVARALAEEADTDPDEDLDEGLYRWETYKPAARAAITAMRAAQPVEGGEDELVEPSYDMLHAALTEARRHDPPLLPSCKEIWAAEVIWRAMKRAEITTLKQGSGE
jgi:hypothetical protein